MDLDHFSYFNSTSISLHLASDSSSCKQMIWSHDIPSTNKSQTFSLALLRRRCNASFSSVRFYPKCSKFRHSEPWELLGIALGLSRARFVERQQLLWNKIPWVLPWKNTSYLKTNVQPPACPVKEKSTSASNSLRSFLFSRINRSDC